MGTAPPGQVRGLKRAARRLRGPKGIFVALLLLLLVCAAVVAATMLRVRGDLSAGRQALLAARRALAAGNLSEAGEQFTRAGDRFADAREETGGLLGRIGSWIPVLGNDVDVARVLADAGHRLSGAGAELTEAVLALPDGVGSLVPARGRFPVETYASLAQALGAARREAEAALGEVTASPASFLTAPVLEARWEAERQITDIVAALRSAELLAEGLPSFAGAAQPRSYLVLSQNPAELRGTGGIWGAFAVLTFRDGVPSFGPVAPTQSLPELAPGAVEAPSQEYEENYREFGGAASWHNMNMTPDFPSAARAALANFQASTGQDLDGVIVADPFALRAMLEVTGPVQLAGVKPPMSAENVIAFTTNEAYSAFHGPVERKEVLGAVATGVFERFLGIEGKGVARLKALTEAVAKAHLRIYSEDPGFQEGLRLGGPPGLASDLVSVSVNNASGAKLDYYALRIVEYEVALGGESEAISELTTTIRNEAPTSGQPRYVIGPYVGGAEAGDQISFVSVWCHSSCELQHAERDGAEIGLTPGTEAGARWYRDHSTIEPRHQSALSATWRSRGVWDGNSSGGTYRLTFLGQTTVRPTVVRVIVNAPEGTEIRWTSPPMDVDGGTAIWQGEVYGRLSLEVRFRAPVPLAWWRNITRPLWGQHT